MTSSSFLDYFNRDQEVSIIDIGHFLEKSKTENDVGYLEVLGEKLYYRFLMSKLDLGKEMYSPEQIIYKFKSQYDYKYLERLTEINMAVAQKTTLLKNPYANKLCHVQTGGFGIVFSINDIIAKFIYQLKFDRNDYCAEYDIPKLLIPYLTYSGCDIMISQPKTIINNIELKFVSKIYQNLCILIHLLYCRFKDLPIDFNEHEKIDYIKTTNKFNEMRNWKIFKYCFRPLYFSLVSSNILIENNLTNIIHLFETKNLRTSKTIGNIIIFIKAIGSIDNLTWCNKHNKIILRKDSELQYNLFYFKPNLLREFFLQLMILFYTIYDKYPTFLHYDLKLNNILLEESKPLYIKLKNIDSDEIIVYYFDSGYVVKLHDFDFSSIPGVYTNIKFPRISNLDITKCNWFYEFRKLVGNLLKNFNFLKMSDLKFYEFLLSRFKIDNENFNSFHMNVKDKDRLSQVEPLSNFYDIISDTFFDRYKVIF